MMMNTKQQNISEKLVLSQPQDESTNQNKENFQSNLYEMINFFQLYEIKILVERISEIALVNYEGSFNFQEEKKGFELALQTLLLGYKEKDLGKHQQLISLIKQFFYNQLNEDQINQIIQQWLSLRLAPMQIQQILDDYSLNSIIQIPEMLDIVAYVIYHHKYLNNYDFYNSFIQKVIIKNLVPLQQGKDFENILQIIEQRAIMLINNEQNTQSQEEFIHYQQPWIESLLKHKQIIDFLVARYFDGWLSKISENSITDLKDEIEVFKAIIDQSKLGTINFSTKNLIGVLNYLRDKYDQEECYKLRLIKMVQASALINNFEQEAGNAMSVLSNLEAIIRNENFSKINLKNSTMNNIQFFQSNFNDSNMSNVSIVSAQFIQCQIYNACWSNLESSDSVSLKAILTIFSSHNSILISMNKSKINDQIDRIHRKFNLSFYNLNTGKQIKILYQQSNFGCRIFSLKLSCQGKILVFNDKEYQSLIFWSIQSMKKIRVNRIKSRERRRVLSGDCQMQARISAFKFINLWKIYNNTEQSQEFEVNDSSIQEIKFSKNNLILILILNMAQGCIFWNLRSGQEIILKEGSKYKISPDGQYYASSQEHSGLTLKRMDNEKNFQIQEGFSDNYIHNFKFSPDGKILAFQNTKFIKLWAIDQEKVLFAFEYDFKWTRRVEIPLMQFTTDGQTLAFKYKDNIVLWKFNKEKCRIEGNFPKIEKIHFQQNGKHFILQDQGTQRVGNFKNQQKYFSINQFPKILDTVQFSSSTSQLAFIYGCNDNQSKTIKIKILNDLKVITEVNSDKESEFTKCALSSDLKKIAYFYQDSISIQKIEGEQTQVIQTLKLTDGQGIMTNRKHIKFSPNGEYLIVIVPINQLRRTNFWRFQIWKINNNSVVYQTELNSEESYNIGSFEFSFDSQNVTLPQCKRTQIFNIERKQFQDLRFEKNHITSSNAFSLDGKFLAFDYDKSENFSVFVEKAELWIWNVEEEKIIQRLEGSFFQINKIIFLNETIIVSSANQECSIQIWKWQVGIQVQVLNLHKFAIDNISISPDRSMMVSKDLKGTVYLWKNAGTQNKVSNQQQILNQGEEYFFVPYSIISNPIFRSVNCSFENSQFSSTEGFNLQSIFSYEK